MGEAFAFALSAAFNPTLLAALMVMLLSANAKRLMFGYLLGALMTSITAGLVIVFALPESSAVSTTKNTAQSGRGPGPRPDRPRRRTRSRHGPT